MSYAKFERYDAHKDSGVEWLGDVPKNWTILRVKDTVIKIGNGVTPKGGSEVYTDVGIPFIRSQNVYDDGLHIGDVSFISDEIHHDMKGSQLKEGDILINITGASIGRTCVVPIELGIANINQHVAFLRTKYWFNTTYISLFLKSPFIKKYIQFEQNGASKEAFNLTQIANIPIILPNVEEQTTIAAYLDTKTTQIDRKIDLLTQKATQYGKLKQSLINETVTRGLDKSVAMKDSGVEWIGEIPEHWEVKRVKDVSSCLDFARIPLNGTEREHINGDIPYWGANGIVDHINKALFNEPLVLIGEDGAPFFDKNKNVAFIVDGPVWVNNHMHILRPHNNIKNSYLMHSLNIVDFKNYINGSTRDKLTQLNLNHIKILFPPIEEQKTITDYLDTKTAHIDHIIETTNAQIEKLEELHKSLINDVVTGKIKVA